MGRCSWFGAASLRVSSRHYPNRREGGAGAPPSLLAFVQEGPEVHIVESRVRDEGPFSGGQREEIAVRGFLDGLVRGARTVMTRVELGGALYVAAVIGVLLTSRKEGSKR